MKLRARAARRRRPSPSPDGSRRLARKKRAREARDSSASEYASRSPRYETLSRNQRWPFVHTAALMNFEVFLDMSCSVVTVDEQDWSPIFRQPSIDLLDFEHLFGRNTTRADYNRKNLDELVRTKRSIFTERFGHTDLWVPMIEGDEAYAAVVCGPFLTRVPTSQSISESWFSLTGKRPQAIDPQFVHFAKSVLATPMFERDELDAVREFLETLAEAWSDKGDLRAHTETMASFRARFSKRPGSLLRRGRAFLNALLAPQKREEFARYHVHEFGIDRAPSQVIALLPRRSAPSESNWLEELVTGHRFQIRGTGIARSVGGVVTAPFGDQGLYVMITVPRRGQAARARARDLVRRFGELARKEFDLKLSAGVGGSGLSSDELPHCAQQALVTLELALHQQEPLLFHDDIAQTLPVSGSAARPAEAGRRVIDAYARSSRDEYQTRLKDFVGQILTATAGQSNAIRAYVDQLLSGLLEVARQHALLDEKSAVELETELYASLFGAGSELALLDCLNTWSERFASLQNPSATAELRLSRAQSYVRENCHRPLTLTATARFAGYSPQYFSALFKRHLGLGFERYLSEQRVERAKRLLKTGELGIARIAEDSGFMSVSHFYARFKQIVGETPKQYRERTRSI